MKTSPELSPARRGARTPGRGPLSTCLALLLLAGLFCTVPRAAVADSSAPGQVIKTVSYTTSPKANKLVWLPYRSTNRPVESEGPDQATATAKVDPNRAEPLVHYEDGPALIVPAQFTTKDRFADPFGDTRAAATATAPKRLPQETVIRVQQLQELKPPNNLFTSEGATGPEVIPAPAPRDNAEGLPGVTGQDQMAEGPALGRYECPTVEDLKPITEITHDTSIKEAGDNVPEDEECPLVNVPYKGRSWSPVTFHWTAPGTCHKPLYFEDVNLERYGHTWGPYLQPVISGGRFFLTVPALPYLMGMDPPTECVYTLGYYRPGSCAPYKLDPIPLSVRGAVAAGGVYTGMVYLIP